MVHFTTFRTTRTAAVVLGLSFLGVGSATAATVLTTSDGVVRNSLCVGFDCANTESFGSATIRLKENNTRIDFVDTSVGSFATRDWRLEANSNASGGANYFAIKDMGNNASAGAEGGTALLTVTAGAPANSIFVSSAGRVGFGTSTPVLDLHRRSGNTPALRLEQDGSSGFAPQTWDIAGNETSFFVRDATNGSTLPFRILPGAPSNSITIVAGGNVGVGTVSPTASMHVRRTNGTAQLFVEEAGASSGQRQLLRLTNNGNALINLTNSSNNNEWLLGGGANMTIRHGTTDTLVFSLAPTGELRIPQLVSCAGLQTNASGVVSCAAGPTPPRSASDIPYAMARAGTSTLATSASLVGSTGAGTPGSPSSGPSSAASNGTSETCAPGDMVGRWKLIATNIAKFGANSVLWCDVQLTQAQVRSESRYSISGNCRSHLPDESTPEKFSVDGKGSITEMATCTMGGSFRIKQGSAVVATANILEGWIEGPVGKKTRAVALSRMPHGRTSTIQTFVLQR